jgi:Asp-tRNA(Asn)/Glu-tRNA(Gln) amidotransferase A subunit family amidase
VTSSNYVARYLWENAGFGKPKLISALDNEAAVYHPAVIPLAQEGDEAAGVGAELFPPQPADLAGRYYSAADYHTLYKSGEVTPLQVAEALLQLIKPPSKYANAWVLVDEDAVLTAARSSTERWAKGQQRGVLDGVPFGVKTDTEVEGYVTTDGLKVDENIEFFKRPADETSWPVQKLEEAGAVMLGKNNMHEIGMDTTGCNPATGTPTNWYNKEYYPGGSSSGAGSALGGGIVPIAVGTDAGGSVRIPASFNGVYGLKVSHGRIPRPSTMCVIGPMAGTVKDLTIAYRLMAQPNPDDPVQSLFAPSIPPSITPSSKRVIGIHPTWLNRATPSVRSTFDTLVKHLSSRGYQTVEITLPYLREGQWAHAATCLTEAAADARARAKNWLALNNLPNRIMLSIGDQTPAQDYLAYNRLRKVIMSHLASLFEQHPGLIILSPTTPLAGWPKTKGDETYGFSDGKNLSVFPSS